MIPEDLRYTEEHEWIRQEGELLVVGVTHFAQDQLGDIVFVELPEVGKQLQAGGTFGVVESVKTVSDLFVPVSGEVADRNQRLLEDSPDFEPALINSDPYGAGWMIKIKPEKPGDANGLLSAQAYAEHIEGEE
ncbi:MAG: glycine cleavage system protein GcvH [Armatimonadetes bacterium]|nr:glycine cleavage system protein GcvH [Armatimonadota bacterium]